MTNTGVVLGFDYGRRRIGVAIGQKLTSTATALETLDARDGKPNWNRVSDLLTEWKPEALVVGMPYYLDGSPSDSSREAGRFARQLEGRYEIPVYLQDERLTSAEAETITAGKRNSGRIKQKSVDIDSFAAQIILQEWLERGE